MSLPGARAEATLAAVQARGLLDNARLLDGPSATSVIAGEASVEGRDVTIRVDVAAPFPLALPSVYLEPPDALGFIPHVMHNGFVCYLDPEGQLLDTTRPDDVVAEAIAKSLSVLSSGVTGTNRNDFVEEFEAYWQPARAGLSLIEPDDHVRTCSAARLLRTAGSSSENPMMWSYTLVRRRLRIDIHEALFLPLAGGIMPPRWGERAWSTNKVQQLLTALNGIGRSRLKKIMKKGSTSPLYIVLRVPKPSGGESLVGLCLDGPASSRRHPLQLGATPGL